MDTAASHGLVGVSDQVVAKRVGLMQPSNRPAMFGASFQSSGGPSEWGLAKLRSRKRQNLGPSFQSSGGPSEWGQGDALDSYLIFDGSFQSSGGPSEWGLGKESGIGMPTTGIPFPIKWGPQRVGPRVRIQTKGDRSQRAFPIKWGPQRVGPCGY